MKVEGRHWRDRIASVGRPLYYPNSIPGDGYTSGIQLFAGTTMDSYFRCCAFHSTPEVDIHS